MPDRLTIPRPDDWHVHLRDGAALATTVPATAAQFRRALVMPNLKPPVTTVAAAASYRARILAARPAGSSFEPFMTLYLTNETRPEEIDRAVKSGFVKAVKLYPAGATTHSDAGVTDITKVYPALRRMEELGLTLCVHGEVTNPDVDIFNRERMFIDWTLRPLVATFPELRIILEHLTTSHGVRFVEYAGSNVAGTITAHHLLYNRNALFQNGIRPHYYCLPVLKREEHRVALLEAATSGNPKFFLGTDSAPHERHTKEAACGCAGCSTAHAALELYAEAFDSVGALGRLEGFASHFGADFYGVPRNTGTVTLVREDWAVPTSYPFGGSEVVPLRAGEQVRWKKIAG
jgi:dihydroorotase